MSLLLRPYVKIEKRKMIDILEIFSDTCEVYRCVHWVFEWGEENNPITEGGKIQGVTLEMKIKTKNKMGILLSCLYEESNVKDRLMIKLCSFMAEEQNSKLSTLSIWLFIQAESSLTQIPCKVKQFHGEDNIISKTSVWLSTRTKMKLDQNRNTKVHSSN